MAVKCKGFRYVAIFGDLSVDASDGPEGRIDVFDPSGGFVTEIPVPEGPTALAVDASGSVYVDTREAHILRFDPTTYDPGSDEVQYGQPPASIPNPHSEWDGEDGLGIDPLTGDLFVTFNEHLVQFGSADEGKPVLDEEVVKVSRNTDFVAIDRFNDLIYITAPENPPDQTPRLVVRAYSLDAPHDLVRTCDGSTIPSGRFGSEWRSLPLAVDEQTGHLFVGDFEGSKKRVYEFDASCNVVSIIEHSLETPNTATDVCRGTHRAKAAFTGQNGRRHVFAPKLVARLRGEEGAREGKVRWGRAATCRAFRATG